MTVRRSVIITSAPKKRSASPKRQKGEVIFSADHLAFPLEMGMHGFSSSQATQPLPRGQDPIPHGTRHVSSMPEGEDTSNVVASRLTDLHAPYTPALDVEGYP